MTPLFALLAPAVGALGSFVPGSATASNVLFSSLQLQVAQAPGLPAPWMAAAQGVGAGIGNILYPHDVVAGAATVGLAGREGEILRRTLVPGVAVLAVAGAAVAAWVAIAPGGDVASTAVPAAAIATREGRKDCAGGPALWLDSLL